MNLIEIPALTNKPSRLINPAQILDVEVDPSAPEKTLVRFANGQMEVWPMTLADARRLIEGTPTA